MIFGFLFLFSATRDAIPAPAPMKGCRQAVRRKFYFGNTVKLGHGESPGRIITCRGRKKSASIPIVNFTESTPAQIDGGTH